MPTNRPGAAQSCDAVRGAASAKANMSTKPGQGWHDGQPKAGAAQRRHPGLGVIKPREIQARIFENDSRPPGPTDPMIGAPSCGSGAPLLRLSQRL